MMQSIQNTTPGKKQSPDELRASHQVSKPRDSSHAVPRRGNVPMTFFMRSEEDMEKSYESAPSSEVDNSTYGVRSIDSETGFNEQQTLADEHRDGSPSRIPGASHMESIPRANSPFIPILARSQLSETSTTSTSTSSSPSRHASRLTRPLTPLLLRSPNANSTTDSAPLSTPRSVSLRSLRLSDDEYSVDEAASQVLTSSGEDEDELNEDTVLAGHDVDAIEAGPAPQLVMPSIKMPIRRPFTERGKSIGKLKIMIVGSKGSGKSALIKSIVQTCDDIVHVDSITSSSSVSMSRSNTQTSSSSRHDAGKTTMNEITEIAASTRAYPKWWTEVDDSQILRRRRRSSMNETVLERNISFIDTPGIDANAADQASKKALQHVEGLLWRNQSFASFSDGEILSVFSGNGGMQVDVVLFLLRDVPSSTELDLIRRLTEVTSVLPVVSHADMVDPDAIAELKQSILATLAEAEIRPFLFGNSLSELITNPSAQLTSHPSLPYAISSSPTTDLESMDSSLLMQPDHTPTLQTSDLPLLVDCLFHPETTAHLRHLSARKFLQWRKNTLGQPTVTATSNSPLQLTTLPQQQGFPLPNFLTSPPSTAPPSYNPGRVPPYPMIPHPSPFTAAHIADHTLRTERLTQVRLARWANELQKSVKSERERYAAMQREERKKWLEERMAELNESELENTGSSTPSSLDDGLVFDENSARRGTSRRKGDGYSLTRSPRDPLGLLAWDEKMRETGGWVVVEVAGACGVFGALAVWVVRSWAVWKAQVGAASATSSELGGGGWGLWE